MKTAVIGSRNFNDYELLVRELDKFQITELISGGARGADQLAARYAKVRGIPLTEHKPDYRIYGKKATYVRNDLIIKECERLIAFWDGKSPGTGSVIDKTRKKGKEVKIILFVLPG